MPKDNKSAGSEVKNRSPDPNVHTQTYIAEQASALQSEMVRASKRKRVQPYKRTEKIEQALWERIACGESLRKICSDPKMPAKSTVSKWMASDPDFEAYINQAYLYQGREIADMLMELADGVDTSLTIEERKLKAKIYIWLAEKYNRKLFGQSTQVELTDTRPVINLPPEFAALAIAQPSIIDGTLVKADR